MMLKVFQLNTSSDEPTHRIGWSIGRYRTIPQRLTEVEVANGADRAIKLIIFYFALFRWRLASTFVRANNETTAIDDDFWHSPS